MPLATKNYIALIVLSVLLLTGIGQSSPVFAASRSNRHPDLLNSRHKFLPVNNSDHEHDANDLPGAVTLFPPSDVKQRPELRVYRKDILSEDELRRRLSSRSVILMDGSTGQVIYEQSPDLPAQPASTIKVLTGLIAIQSLQDGDLVPVSRRAANMPRSKVYLQRSKSYQANDLINAVLLSSANDASVALAEKIAGSEKVFSKLMTHKARAWGATNTICKTATGLTVRGQQTTARDLAVLFNRAMENDEFATRVGRSKVKTGFGKVLRNHNKALWEIAGTEGGKTGYTLAARQTYVGKFKRGDDEMLLALLGSETMWDDIKNLVSYGFEAMAASDEGRSAYKDSGNTASILVPVSLNSGYALQVLSDHKKASVF
jgi:D-alanyl-D-alanine carboxypeptidase